MQTINRFWSICIIGALACFGIFLIFKAKKSDGVLGQIFQQSSFVDTFSKPFTLAEAGSARESKDSDWWVNSGGYFIGKDGRAGTIQGPLPQGDDWQAAYARANPTDTDNGLHPQNIFRLITKDKWKNFTQEAYFKITADNLSTSGNRNESNGLLLFNHYQDENTLYYAGVRVDGYAVIKKKYAGTYTTMLDKQIFPGTYDKAKHPNLLPKNEWIGLRTVVVTASDGSVNVTLYMDLGWSGNWVEVLSTTDNGQYNSPPILSSGYAGIRTDFMDVLFDNYKITETQY